MTECRILCLQRPGSRALRSARGFGKTPRWSGEENDGWRLIKCRHKRPRLPLVTDTDHAAGTDKDVGKRKGYNMLRVGAAPKKSGENDSIRFELWRKCVEKLGSGLRAADKRRLCTVETYPSASATTTFQPQGGGESAPINPHPRRWKVVMLALRLMERREAARYSEGRY